MNHAGRVARVFLVINKMRGQESDRRKAAAGTRETKSEKKTQEADAFASASLPAPPSRWLSVNQIRQMQRCRRETVVEAMLRGELPFEQRGRIRYARLSDVIRWEEQRLRPDAERVSGLIHPDLQEFV